MIASKLHEEVSSVCPIYGVSVGDENDRTTWKFHPKEESSEQQISDANNAIKTFVYSSPTKDEIARELSDHKLLSKAEWQVNWNSIPALKLVFPTYAEYQTAIINQYKALI